MTTRKRSVRKKRLTVSSIIWRLSLADDSAACKFKSGIRPMRGKRKVYDKSSKEAIKALQMEISREFLFSFARRNGIMRGKLRRMIFRLGDGTFRTQRPSNSRMNASQRDLTRKRGSNMDKKKKIAIAASAAAVAVIIGAVAITQGARLKTAASVAKSATMDEAQVTAKADENAQITQELQDQYEIPEITLTPEMEAAIADGSMTLEEAAAQFISGGSSETESVSEAETPNAESAAQASETDSDAQSAPEAATETPEPSQPENAAPMPEPSQPEAVETMPEPSATQSVAPMPEPEPTPAPKAEEPPAPEPSKPSEPEETASLSGETDGGQTEASKADAGRTEAETPKANNEQSEAPKANADAGQTETASDSGQTEKSAEEKAKEEQDAKVQNLFAQLYVLKNSFSNRVDAIINERIDEFLAMDPSKQTRITKIRLVYARMDDFEAMEADCNAQVESIASQLDEIDPALGEKARQYYQNEKELKKSSLIAQYGG